MDPLPILRRYLQERGDLVAAWLFGSLARGDAGPDSDVDVAILLPGRRVDPLQAQMIADDVQADLAPRLGAPIDVVPLNNADLELTHRALRDGELLHETDHRARIRFELRHQQEFFDFMPVIEAYRRKILADA
ncbi:MAG: nucleotidyltransferase domain-containing protein [Planctomycetes bacterium]|nr:nucleotidyltransferase domain-containing protein [Planctomycetota bacterium]